MTDTGQLTFDAEQAGEAADKGMSDAMRALRVQDWRQRADIWLSLRRVGEEFTADDLVAAIGLPDQGVHRNNVVGGWMNAQARGNRIKWTGEFRKSERVIGHGNLQRVWRRA